MDSRSEQQSNLTGQGPNSSVPAQVQPYQSMTDLQLKEAEWISQELHDIIRLIQQYRGLYVTAVFVSLGWLIGKVLDLSVSPAATTANSQAFNLQLIRERTDIAILLTSFAIVNLLFSLLMLEAYMQQRNLARYRFALGYSLGHGKPAWRFEYWRDQERSTRAWTNSLNVFFFFVATLLTGSTLWFAYPAAAHGSAFLKVIWSIAGALFFILTFSAVLLGIRLRSRSAIAGKPVIDWSKLCEDDNKGELKRSDSQSSVGQ